MAQIFQTSDANFAPQKIKSFLQIHENYFGFPIRFPYIYIQGTSPGPKCVILAGIHGDELNGIHIIHRLSDIIQPEHIKGEVALLPMVNIPGFNLHSRYLPDRRDLNRLFPGAPKGSEGRRLAALLWETFIQDCDFAMDLHSASYDRWNFPHIRGDMRVEQIRKMAQDFGTLINLHSRGVSGSLRREAAKINIPIILFEAGQINRFERSVADIGIRGALKVLEGQGMLISWPKSVDTPNSSSIYYHRSHWIRANNGGLFVPFTVPGDPVAKGDVLGEIRSIQGDIVSTVKSNLNGRVIGFSLHPQVVPGRALYNIGYEPKEL